MTKASQVLLWFFWIAFAAFLLASIPHVAWFFSVFEPHDGDGNIALEYWCVSYGIAISIDVTTFLLSMTVAGLAKQKKSKKLIFSVWLFILALAGLSWFINGKYATHFEYSGEITASPVSFVLFSHTLTIADINPVIASCFQALAVAYTWIADKIAANEAPKTATQLQAEADELEAISIQKARIASQRKKNFSTTIGDLAEQGNIVKQGLSTILARKQDELTDEEESEESTEQTERDTDELEAITSEELTEEPERTEQGTSKKTLPVIDIENLPEWLSTGGTTISLKTVSREMNISMKKLNNRVESHEIRATKNRNIVYKSSLIAWLKTEGYLQEPSTIIHLNLVENEEERQEIGIDQFPETDIEKLDITLAILKENETITDEQLAEKLNLKRPASARFWRLKAHEILQNERQTVNA